MELVEATAEDLDALVERWYSLAKAMEAHDELNELVYADVDEVPTMAFALISTTRRSPTTSSSTRRRRSGLSRSERATTHPGSTRSTFAL